LLCCPACFVARWHIASTEPAIITIVALPGHYLREQICIGRR
jgi:hypothetical protein